MRKETESRPAAFPPRYQRHQLLRGLEVHNAEDGQLLGHLVDIDPRGMKLIGSRQLPPGQRYQLRITLPAKDFQTPDLHCLAETRWCNPAGYAGAYQSGLTLTHLDAELLDNICRLINLFGYRQRARKFLDRPLEPESFA